MWEKDKYKDLVQAAAYHRENLNSLQSKLDKSQAELHKAEDLIENQGIKVLKLKQEVRTLKESNYSSPSKSESLESENRALKAELQALKESKSDT